MNNLYLFLIATCLILPLKDVSASGKDLSGSEENIQVRWNEACALLWDKNKTEQVEKGLATFIQLFTHPQISSAERLDIARFLLNFGKREEAIKYLSELAFNKDEEAYTSIAAAIRLDKIGQKNAAISALNDVIETPTNQTDLSKARGALNEIESK